MRYNPLNACGGVGGMACAPLQILVTNGVPEGAPDPNVYLPIAYNAAAGCFYLYQENTGWFVGTGITFDYDEEAGILTLTQCDQILEIPVGGGSVVTEGLVQDLSFDPDTLELTLTFIDEDQDPIVIDLSALASDFYADSVTFDDETRLLTISRTGGLPDLTTEIPAGQGELPEGTEGQVVGYGEDGLPVAVDLPDPQFPETGTPFFLLQRGAAGGVLTEGRLFLGTLLSTASVYPDDAIVPAVPGDAADTAAFGRLRATANPDRITLAKRGDTGTLKAADAVDPDDLVTLAQLNDATGDAIPEGNENDVLLYGEDGVPEAGKITPNNLEIVDFPDETVPPGFFAVPVFAGADNTANFKVGMANVSDWLPDAYSLALRDRDGTLKAAPAEDDDDLVTLAQLNAALPDALPEGTEFDVLRYGADGEPEAGRIDLRHMISDGVPIQAGVAHVPAFLYAPTGDLVASGGYPVTSVPSENAVPMYATNTSGADEYFVLQSHSLPRNLWFDATTVVSSSRLIAPVTVEMFRDAIRPLYAAIEAIDPIADPTAATVEDVATKVNEVIATLKALLP